MLQKFQDHLRQNFQFLSGKKSCLLQVAGKTVWLLFVSALDYRIGMHIVIFSCGMESFEDQNFVQEYARK
jgi:tRNA(Ile)-lysidine synthase